jgi:hypothetical protein
MDDIVATSDRIYRLVLNVYPRAFRDEYGEEMAQAMRDQVRDAWVEGRVLGVTALWLKVLLDTARSAITGHLMQGRTVSFSRRGLGYGLATAIGYPLVFVSFVAWSGELVGFETAENWLAHRRYLYPVFAGPGFVLAGIGLRALYQRLEVSEPLAIRGVRLGVALGLAGIAGIIAGLGGREDYFAGFTIPAALVLFTFGLANMGRIAIRKKTFGVLSFVPLAAAASAGIWFLSLPRQLSGGFHNVFQTSSTLAHVALWFIVGALLWADPPGNKDAVRAAQEDRQINS